jgi:hypothetical protein
VDAISTWIGRGFRVFMKNNPQAVFMDIKSYVTDVYKIAFQRIDLQIAQKMTCFYNDAELHLADPYLDRRWKIVISKMEGDFNLLPGIPCVLDNCSLGSNCPLDKRVSINYK